MGVRAKVFEYAASVGPDGSALAEGETTLAIPGGWLPEHLLLAAVARCTLKSLRFHAQRSSLGASGSAQARCRVTRPAEGEPYRIVELEIDFDVTLEPDPAVEVLAALLGRAERDCFVGNSLVAKPRYRWSVNGHAAEAAS